MIVVTIDHRQPHGRAPQCFQELQPCEPRSQDHNVRNLWRGSDERIASVVHAANKGTIRTIS